MARWFPVARSAELVPRHVAQTQLLGQEIALWRSDDGGVNAWENRCPHRGVRLSIGFNTGAELRCQYHGWRFAAGSGQCTFIPAHPAQKPASGIRTGVYAAVERCHLVWMSLDPLADALDLPPLFETTQDRTLRCIFVNAPAEAVSDALAQGYRIDATTTAPVTATDAFRLTTNTHPAGSPPAVTFLLQPVSDAQTVIHGMLQPDALTPDRVAVLRYHNAQLSRVRDEVERRYTASRAS